MTYDSRVDTLKHSLRVGELLTDVIGALCYRAVHHDLSKTKPPEVAYFDEHSEHLSQLTYGSEEYRAELRAMKPGVEHHYQANRHHPEHFADGVAGMTLVDVMEMLADWKAASERTRAGGSLSRSLEINTDRFALSDDLAAILTNTARHFGWLDAQP